jgi:branched-chain amino acid transport system permease protein
MDFFYTYIVLAEIYVLAVMSTNLLVAITGIFSVSQAAIVGIGAYVVGAATLNGAVPFVPACLLAVALCIVVNVAITLPALRVAGDYFVVTSFGIQLLATAAFTNLTDLTGGANGMPAIPPPELFGVEIGSTGGYLVLCSAVTVAGAAGFWLLLRSPFGRLLRALREDELAVAAAGKRVLYAKVAAAAVAGAYAGIAGALYASFLSFIDPSSFDIDASVLLVTMMVVGGARTLAGSIVGPFLLLGLPQLLNLLAVPTTYAGSLRQFIYGALLVACMLFRPQGLAGEKL